MMHMVTYGKPAPIFADNDRVSPYILYGLTLLGLACLFWLAFLSKAAKARWGAIAMVFQLLSTSIPREWILIV